MTVERFRNVQSDTKYGASTFETVRLCQVILQVVQRTSKNCAGAIRFLVICLTGVLLLMADHYSNYQISLSERDLVVLTFCNQLVFC